MNVVLTPDNREDDTETDNVTIDAGRKVVATCLKTLNNEPPTWEINNISYLPSDLPFGYETNAVNLTFVAYENITIRCGYYHFNYGIVYSERANIIVHPTAHSPTGYIFTFNCCVELGGLKHRLYRVQ